MGERGLKFWADRDLYQIEDGALMLGSDMVGWMGIGQKGAGSKCGESTYSRHHSDEDGEIEEHITVINCVQETKDDITESTNSRTLK